METESLEGLRIDPKYREKSHGWLKWLIVVVVVLLLSGAAIYYFFPLSRKAKTRVEVKTITIKKKTASVEATTLVANGYVESRRKAVITSTVTAKITDIQFAESSKVKEDQVLALLDDERLRAELASALLKYDVVKATVGLLEMKLKNADKKALRNTILFNKNIISRDEYEQIQLDRDILKGQLKKTIEQTALAESQIEIIRKQLNEYVIRAPFDGVALSKDANIGEIVSPASSTSSSTRGKITTIVDMNSLEIEVDINESYISKIYKGQKVTAVLDAYPNSKKLAHVRTIIPSANRQKATFKVRISFDKLTPEIFPDMGVKVYFQSNRGLDKYKEGTSVYIPSEALFQKGPLSYVFIIKNGVIKKQEVIIGDTKGSNVEIISGLSYGTTVVVRGHESLEPGGQLRI